MKKLIILFSVAIALVACAKVESEKQEVNPSTPVTFNVKVASTDTKAAAKSDWANGDVIYLVFKGITDKYLSLTYNSSLSTWTPSPTFVVGDFSGLGEYSFTAVHFPIAVTPAMSAGALSFTVGGKPVYTYYMQQEGAAYTFDGGEVSVTINLTKADGYVQFHVPGITSYIEKYSFAANDVQPVACSSINASTGAIAEVSKNVGAAFGGFLDAEGAVFSAKVTKNGTNQAYTFMLTSNTNIYAFTKPRTLTAGTFYRFEATTGDSWTTKKVADDMDYVDLGLPSGTKWAKCNLGAAEEHNFGKYFAWGETTGHPSVWNGVKWTTDYSFIWSNYSLCHEGNNHALTKYCFDSAFGYNGFTDNKLVLEAIDDAAYNTLGTGWRMPTQTEWAELVNKAPAIQYVTWEWQENYNSTGIKGYKVSNITDPSKYIFLPAAGNADAYYPETGYAPNVDWVNGLCDYWASTLYNSDPETSTYKKNAAYSCDGGDTGSGPLAKMEPANHSMMRYLGLSVRAVYVGE